MTESKLKEGVLFGGISLLVREGKRQVLKKDGDKVSQDQMGKHRWDELLEKGHVISSKAHQEMRERQKFHKENPSKVLKEAEKLKEGVEKEQKKLEEERKALAEERKSLDEEWKKLEEEKKALEKSKASGQK